MDTFVQEIRRKILFLSILGHLAMNVKLRNWYIDAEFRGAEFLFQKKIVLPMND